MSRNLTPICVIVKVTHSCNLDCIYCYTNPKAEKGIMDFETLENMIIKFSVANNQNQPIKFIWHGGEPLLAGLDFYKKVFEIQERIPEYDFINDIQTNGTLLNEEMLQFFSEYEFRIGISLDGYQNTHDANRHYKNGKQSFNDVFEGYLAARKNGTGSGVICVVNENTANNIYEIYQFFKQNKISENHRNIDYFFAFMGFN